MQFTDNISDDAVIQELGRRLARLRLNLDMTQAALAEAAEVGRQTIEKLEHGRTVHATKLIRVLRALQLLDNLDLLVPDCTAPPIGQQQEGKPIKRRQRARPPPKARQRARSRVASQP